jgi:hypothetical protein
MGTRALRWFCTGQGCDKRQVGATPLAGHFHIMETGSAAPSGSFRGFGGRTRLAGSGDSRRDNRTENWIGAMTRNGVGAQFI